MTVSVRWVQKIIPKPLTGIQVACKEVSKKEKNGLDQREVSVQLHSIKYTVMLKTFFWKSPFLSCLNPVAV